MNDAPETQSVLLRKIDFEAKTQCRKHGIHDATVDAYAKLMEGGTVFPPVDLFTVEGTEVYFIGDGFHRLKAYKRLKHESAEAVIHQGNARDAFLFNAKANSPNGLQLSDEDKKEILWMICSDDQWQTWPNTKIAEHCGLSARTVKEYIEKRLPKDKRRRTRVVIRRNGRRYTTFPKEMLEAPTLTRRNDSDDSEEVKNRKYRANGLLIAPKPPVPEPERIIQRGDARPWDTMSEKLSMAQGVFSDFVSQYRDKATMLKAREWKSIESGALQDLDNVVHQTLERCEEFKEAWPRAENGDPVDNELLRIQKVQKYLDTTDWRLCTEERKNALVKALNDLFEIAREVEVPIECSQTDGK